ncbi:MULTISPECIES: general stress protein [unclassified Pseudomonas]|uniref:general stress protein n=1 Tax=unclassified Pseudomonas TaxID=196821 RepID=UPI0025F11B41|nr:MULTISPECIES: KGG domain-containing protein [unclassified Pseudomonas]
MANTGKSNSGNFANDREKASEAGKKGGQASGGNNASDSKGKASTATESGKKGNSPSKGGAGRSS